MITIIDYGLGNVKAFYNVFKTLNVPARVATTAVELAGSTKIILPGVGAFDYAMERLNASGMRDALDRLVLDERVPVLGICVGMQMLASSSDEGKLSGLDWIDGKVRSLAAISADLALPHMGWNDVRLTRVNPLFTGLESANFYFLHSYYFECTQHDDVLAESDYGAPFCCAVNSTNIFGVQFHPEKSHQYGTLLLKNFAAL